MAYTLEQKANALAILKSNGLNILVTAKTTKIARATLTKWVKEIRAADAEVGTKLDNDQKSVQKQLSKLVTERIDDLKLLMEDEIRNALGEGLPQARELASYKDRVTAAAILTDKVQLLKGEATVINENRNSTNTVPSTAKAAIAEQLKRQGYTSN